MEQVSSAVQSGAAASAALLAGSDSTPETKTDTAVGPTLLLVTASKAKSARELKTFPAMEMSRMHSFFHRNVHRGPRHPAEALIFMFRGEKGGIGFAATENEPDKLICVPGPTMLDKDMDKHLKVCQLASVLADNVLFRAPNTPQSAPRPKLSPIVASTPAQRALLARNPHVVKEPTALYPAVLAVHQQDIMIGCGAGSSRPTFTFNYILLDTTKLKQPEGAPAIAFQTLSGVLLPENCRPKAEPGRIAVSNDELTQTVRLARTCMANGRMTSKVCF